MKPNENLAPVQTVVARLSEEIVTGQYLPGARLKEQELALRFGTSRAPLREAFRVLEREGLVEILPWRGVQVSRPTLEEIKELFDVRAEVFGLCARRLTKQGDAADIARIQQEIAALIVATEEGCDEKAYKVRTNAISVMMSSMVGNRYLHEIMADLRSKMFWYYCFLGTSTLERRRESNAVWRCLSKALHERDATKAEWAASTVISASGDFALRMLEAMSARARSISSAATADNAADRA
jgi:DNA-binding GntR family transcriptional regulator